MAVISLPTHLVEFYNHNHGAKGLFATGPGGRGARGTSNRKVAVLDRWNHPQGGRVRQHGVPIGPGKQIRTKVPGVRSKASMKLAKEWYKGRVAEKALKSSAGVKKNFNT